ncbi:D-alanyl-D-alanine carboxypeptidase [Cytobacillus purgationiresistens]|uniref:D-alanyl-D-alanine carboxypeptidase n=2 Tax=Cytobacillus purgationiresistens TaxID=863449 RepID=A0ABU0AB10_9BACI|nr:D-alanyl-D-alanine carboxypeptidase [Cytobacillus purgationiresistens]
MILTLQVNSYVHAEEIEPEILSESAIVMESTTGAILYDKNAEDMMYPASLTKIATAIYAIEKGRLNDVVTVSEEATNVDGTKVYLEVGEKVKLKKLIQGMLINSGNDAASAIAEHLHGNIEDFSHQLNGFLAEEIGVKNTHFTNPHGLYNDKHYTTAKDLAMITNYALKNETFTEIFGTKELKWKGESWDTSLVSHHQMLNGERPYNWITGGKTGFVNEAKQTLASSASDGSLDLTAIVLKADYKRDIYKDTANILDYSFAHYINKEFVPSEEYVVNDKIYTLEDTSISVTVPKAGFKEKITSQGEILLSDNEERAIQTIQLKEEEGEEGEEEHVASNQALNRSASDDDHSHYLKSIMLGTGVIILLIFLFLYQLWRKKRRKQSEMGYIVRRRNW